MIDIIIKRQTAVALALQQVTVAYPSDRRKTRELREQTGGAHLKGQFREAPGCEALGVSKI